MKGYIMHFVKQLTCLGSIHERKGETGQGPKLSQARGQGNQPQRSHCLPR